MSKTEKAMRSIRRLMTIKDTEALAEALPELTAAMAALPEFAPGWHLLGILHLQIKSYRNAEQFCRKAWELDPDKEIFVRDYAHCLYLLKRYPETIKISEEWLSRAPENHFVRFLWGSSLAKLNHLRAAEEQLVKIPFHADLSAGQWHETGSFFLRKITDYARSGAALEKAVQLEPGDFRARNELGWHYVAVFAFAKAASAFLQAAQDADKPWNYYSNYLFVSTYYLDLHPEELLQRHQGWHTTYAPIRQGGITKRRSRAKPLKIGYVSGDFRKHVVWNFIEPVIRGHDRRRVSVHCYHQWKASDAHTDHLRSLADEWTDCHRMRTEDLVDEIRRSEIDVLVDLSGHTDWNRLDIFAERCAPIQISYLGYIATTGIDGMDVRMSDAVLTPTGTPEPFSEQLYRLPRCYKAYRADQPWVQLESRDGADHLVFGSLHRLQKITEATMELWAEILAVVPQSKLLIARHELKQAVNRKSLLARLQARGIPEKQLILMGSWQGSHLQIYNEIDIALDTVPVTGGATTAEAIWMGVPVVTRAGLMMRERISASILHGLGRPEWIASSNREITEIAANLAREIRRPAFSKKALRQHFLQSELADGASLATALEDAYESLV
jgi:predicted O-linked N-acetylglucosamine transferase (SPINDLY family)